MSEFSRIWYDEVKPVAKECILEPEYIRIMYLDSFTLEDKDKKLLKDINSKYKDAYGMYYISNMINAIDNALSKNMEREAYMFISLVYSTLCSKDYFEKIFDGDSSTKEWQTRINLKNKLAKLIGLNPNNV